MKRVLGYDVADLKKRPLKSDVDTGYAQSFEFDPAHRELYIYNADEEEIYVLDTTTLALKRKIAAPDISPGDPWIRRCPHSDTVVIASEADQQKGNPFVVFDGTTGAVVGIALKLSNQLNPDGYLPFGPFLAVAAGLLALWGPQAVLQLLGL